jgi:hypothetical protein
VDSLAGRLDDAAASLTAAERSLLSDPPSAAVFGADTGGVPGRLGRALHEQWAAVLTARAREAAATAARLTELGQAVHDTVERYEWTDDLARRRLHREP